MQPVENHTKIESIYIRHRNALLLRGDFTSIFTDYYLHLMDHGLRIPPQLDGMLKDALAMITLHLTARPWAETIAWTANLRAPRINLFVTGSSIEEEVTGRIFTEDVREPDRNFFYSQTTTDSARDPRLSTLEVDGRDPVRWISQYYDQSEQRPARAFRMGEDRYALVVAQPDCDLDWLATLDPEAVSQVEIHQETGTLENRRFRFACGCSLEKILPVLSGWRDRPDELFGGEELIRIQCPRCAAKYDVSRGML